ncbi:MAG: Uma2 family endonuclease [Pyrinomonadaceae bacterium]
MEERILRDDSKSGSSRQHNLISTNTIVAIGSRIKGNKCEIYPRDMVVKLGDYLSYPDITIVAEEPKFADNNAEILLNPTVVIEVFSKSTVAYDKTVKLDHYLQAESIREILLISEDEVRVEHYFKQNPKQWIYRIYNSTDDIISLESVNCKISVSEIYIHVRLDQANTRHVANGEFINMP